MTRHSLFKKYFAVCSVCVSASIAILGVVLLVFASQYFERDKYDMLERNAIIASQATAGSYTSSGFGVLNKNFIISAYTILSESSGAEFFLANVAGEVIYSRQDFQAVPADIVRLTLQGSAYKETGTLGGLLAEPHYIVAVPVIAEGVPIGVLFAATSASGMGQLMRGLVEMFLISAIVVFVISFVLIYFITASLIKPLKEMLAATQSFSQGDFSKRVPVAGFDEIGQLAMAFNAMASTLATTESSRRSFVANVSHELKTPMTTISGFVDGILDGTVPPEKHGQYLQIVSTEVKRLSRLVRSMLDTARIEAGEMQLAPVAFDISETVRQCVFTFEQTITDKQLEIEGLDADKILVCADRDLMHQVIYNLVENAVKFVDHGGKISVSYHSDGRMAHVAVRNTGQGLEKQEIPQLFERFYKSDKSRSLNKNGVGLGLHIVKSIVNYHKGEILVRSVEGEYTEFEFSVPAAPKNAARQES